MVVGVSVFIRDHSGRGFSWVLETVASVDPDTRS